MVGYGTFKCYYSLLLALHCRGTNREVLFSFLDMTQMMKFNSKNLPFSTSMLLIKQHNKKFNSSSAPWNKVLFGVFLTRRGDSDRTHVAYLKRFQRSRQPKGLRGRHCLCEAAFIKQRLPADTQPHSLSSCLALMTRPVPADQRNQITAEITRRHGTAAGAERGRNLILLLCLCGVFRKHSRKLSSEEPLHLHC